CAAAVTTTHHLHAVPVRSTLGPSERGERWAPAQDDRPRSGPLRSGQRTTPPGLGRRNVHGSVVFVDTCTSTGRPSSSIAPSRPLATPASQGHSLAQWATSTRYGGPSPARSRSSAAGWWRRS